MNLYQLLAKILNLPVALRTRVYPTLNRVLLHAHGATIGHGVRIPGRFYLLGGG